MDLDKFMLAEGLVEARKELDQMLSRYYMEHTIDIWGYIRSYSFLNLIGNAIFFQVALKCEHRSSKGCNHGPPYEWQVYK